MAGEGAGQGQGQGQGQGPRPGPGPGEGRSPSETSRQQPTGGLHWRPSGRFRQPPSPGCGVHKGSYQRRRIPEF